MLGLHHELIQSNVENVEHCYSGNKVTKCKLLIYLSIVLLLLLSTQSPTRQYNSFKWNGWTMRERKRKREEERGMGSCDPVAESVEHFYFLVVVQTCHLAMRLCWWLYVNTSKVIPYRPLVNSIRNFDLMIQFCVVTRFPEISMARTYFFLQSLYIPPFGQHYALSEKTLYNMICFSYLFLFPYPEKHATYEYECPSVCPDKFANW